jgi:polar amino acid transport system substrate-binding protein
MKSVLKICFTLLVLALFLGGCKEGALPIESIAQLNDPQYTIGYEEGQSSATVLLKTHPKAKLKSFTDKVVGFEALRQGKIDGFAFERLQMQEAIDGGLKGVRLMDETLGDTIDVAIGISPVSKIPELENRINEFLDSIRHDGTLSDMRKRWFELGDEKIPDIAKPENPTLHLKVGTSGVVKPYSYYKDNVLNGFDIELSRRLALWLNAEISFGIYDYGAIVAAAVSGDIDCIVANLNKTKERAERIRFSTPISRITNGIMVQESRYVARPAESVEVDLKDVPPQFRDMKLKYNSIADMNRNGNLILGMQTGFVFVDKETRRLLPSARIDYYKSTPDMAYLVANGKLDGFVNDEPVIRYAALQNPNLGYIHAGFEPMNIVVAFPKTEKGRTLRDEMNEFIEKHRKAGTLDSLDDLWLGHDEEKKVVHFPKAKPGRPTLKMGTSAESAPFEYIKDGKVVGYEMMLMALFCEEYGYGVDVHNVPFESLLLGLETSTYDFVASTLSEMPSVTEHFYHTGSIYVSECVMAVQILDKGLTAASNGETAAQDLGAFASLKLSFEKTFIRESRWKLVVHGIGITMFISILSAVLGTLIGFGVCLMRLSRKKTVDAIAITYIRILQGTPSVVLLMILFYVVFARTGLDGVWVAIIGFGMNFGAYVSEMMRTGIEAVDRGQMEAALSLGYSKPRAFFKIVFPQAARHFLPVYQGEFISLVKMTSIVGYIAIQDLTKASDIIRSRTYEAFFPLITTAIIYFAIAWVLTRALTAIQKRIDPVRRRDRNRMKL